MLPDLVTPPANDLNKAVTVQLGIDYIFVWRGARAEMKVEEGGMTGPRTWKWRNLFLNACSYNANSVIHVPRHRCRVR